MSDISTVHENSNTTTGTTSHAVALVGGDSTTAGNTVLVFTQQENTTLTAPAGFSLDAGGGAGNPGVYRKSDVAAGETSWTFTTGASSSLSWTVKELSNVDPVEPLDVTVVNSASVSNGGTISTGTTAQNASLSVVVYALFGSVKAAATTVSFSGYTNGFIEDTDTSSSGLGTHLAVASKSQDGTTGTFESTATRATTGIAETVTARIVAYRAADAPLAAPLAHFVTWGWGTHGGMGNSSPSNPQNSALAAQGTWGSAYQIGSSFAIDGTYGLRLAVSAAIAAVAVTPTISYPSIAFGGWVRPVSGSGVVVLGYADNATDLQVVYDHSTNKLGLRWGAGTIASQSGTTALNTAVWIDVRAKANSATFHAEWWLDDVAQTSPADLTGQTPANFTVVVTGVFPTTQTMTTDYGTWIVSRYYAAGPLGKHWGKVLVPATTGASVVGTSTNFSEFTANGTLAAFASTSGQRIDEVPPTISASSDGVVQTAVAASDYMKFPMTDPSLASDEVLGAVRAVVPTWGGTGTGTGTLWLAVSDGVTETVIDAGSSAYDGDSLTAASSTYPIWRSGMITPPAGGWNPTRGNALEARVGKSGDATPDMGVSAFYLGYVIRKAITTRQVTLEDPISATVDLRVNPYNSASVSYLITNNDATRSVNFNYTGTGTPSSPVTVGPSATQEVTVAADAFGDISDLSLEAI